jgi:sugar phosphate isomerase/epimerase
VQLSCLPVSFFSDIIDGRMTVGAWAAMGTQIGLDAIDLSILFVPDRSSPALAKMRRDIEAAGMSVTMVTSYPDFTHPDPAQRQRELELEVEAVTAAAALGARYVRVTAGQSHPQTGRSEGIAWATEGLIQLVEATRALGVTLVYENHSKPGAWQYTDFSEPPDIFLEIVVDTADCGLGVNFDTANATAFGRDPVQLLEQVIDRVETIHASDTAARGTLQHTLLGTGLVPFPALFTTLKQAGWDGWICMEEAAFQGQAGVESAARYVRQAWDAA